MRGDPRPRARLHIAANVPAAAEGTGGIVPRGVSHGRGQKEILRVGREQGKNIFETSKYFFGLLVHLLENI